MGKIQFLQIPAYSFRADIFNSFGTNSSKFSLCVTQILCAHCLYSVTAAHLWKTVVF